MRKDKAQSGMKITTEYQAGNGQTPADRYVLIGDNTCSGGGFWKRYQMNTVTPGSYSYCSQACDGKEECIGFDVGTTGCNLYTQKAVAIGTWPGVQFNVDEAFAGAGDHDAFPQTPYDLTLGTSAVATDELYKCYRKTFYKPADSYYWLVGSGTCSGGGAWKRYKMGDALGGTYHDCENACNLRDECIGFDVGTWDMGDTVVQQHLSSMLTIQNNKTSCFFYAQKPVTGTWPGVQIGSTIAGTGEHDDFPPTPYDLSVVNMDSTMSGYNVGGNTLCYGKTHWVELESYYMELGKATCVGWKHYKASAADTKDKCKKKCDEKDECVGVDWDGSECRLFTSIAVASGSWTDVTMDGSGAFAGVAGKDFFAPTPFTLSPDTAAAGETKSCLAKTHFKA